RSLSGLYESLRGHVHNHRGILGAEPDVGEHTGSQSATGIGQLNSDAQRARLRVGLRKNGHDTALEALVRIGDDAHRNTATYPYFNGGSLGNGRLQPYIGDSVDRGNGGTTRH